MTAAPLKMTAREIGCRTGGSRSRGFGSLSYESAEGTRQKTKRRQSRSLGSRTPKRVESAWTEARAIGAERARAHTSRQAGGRERRRHIAQGSAAIAALREVIFGDAEPVAAGVTLRIDALNGPAGQILHRLPPDFSREPAGERARATARNSGSDRKSWADNVPQFGGCQEEVPQYVVADWRQRKKPQRHPSASLRASRMTRRMGRGESRIQ
jgi:hypothetical protein